MFVDRRSAYDYLRKGAKGLGLDLDGKLCLGPQRQTTWAVGL